MICPSCNASPSRLCATHAQTSNHETESDMELDELQNRVRTLERELAEARAEAARHRPVYPKHPKMTQAKFEEIEHKLGWAPTGTWPIQEHIHFWAWKVDGLFAERDTLRAQFEDLRVATNGALDDYRAKVATLERERDEARDDAHEYRRTAPAPGPGIVRSKGWDGQPEALRDHLAQAPVPEAKTDAREGHARNCASFYGSPLTGWRYLCSCKPPPAVVPEPRYTRDDVERLRIAVCNALGERVDAGASRIASDAFREELAAVEGLASTPDVFCCRRSEMGLAWPANAAKTVHVTHAEGCEGKCGFGTPDDGKEGAK